MALDRVTGADYQTGMFKVTGYINQSGGKKSSGQIRVFRNEDGDVASVYKVDAGSKQITFEGLLQANVEPPKKGEYVDLPDASGSTSKRYYIEQAIVVYKNDDAQKIRVTANFYADLA